MSTVYLGIDPGNSGAIGVLYPDGFFSVYDCPTISYRTTSGREYTRISEDGMDKILWTIKKHDSWPKESQLPVFAAIEEAQAAPQGGVASMFAYGTGYGMWRGVLAAHKIPRKMVRPNEWMRAVFAGRGTRDKRYSLLAAQQLFPDAPLSLAKHHNRAEALLIAYYAKQSRMAES